MEPAITTALISTATALAGAAVGALSSRGTLRLQHSLEERRQRSARQQAIDEATSRFKEPLLSAAFDLASRIYNIATQDFLQFYVKRGDAEQRDYARTSTLFLFGQYFCWVEIMRRKVQFLNLGDDRRNMELVKRLESVQKALASDGIPDPTFLVFRTQLRALGECMIRESDVKDGSTLDCIGYVTFAERLEDPDFAKWFVGLKQSIETTASGPPAAYDRLIRIQHALISLLQFADDPPTRFPPTRMQRIAPPVVNDVSSEDGPT